MFSRETIAARFAKYCTNLSFQEISQDAVKIAKRCILDSIGCILAGSKTIAGGVAIEVAREAGGKPQSTLFGTGEKTSTATAAFANAIMANALDFDDVWFGHPGATVIPSAIAVGEALDVSGQELLTAILAGYEVSMRIAKAIQPSYGRRHTVWGAGTWQVFGSVCAAGKLLHLDEEQFTMALGIAGCNAPVPANMKSLYGIAGATMVKNNFGTAAMSGVISTFFAQRGFTGPPDILDGEKGFWRIYGSDRCDFGGMTRRLGETNEILKLSFKPYPLCRYTHAAVDGLLNLVEAHKIACSEIREILIRVPRHITVSPFNNHKPENMLQAQFSFPFAMAVALSGIEPGPEWLSDERFRSAELRRTAMKVRLAADTIRRWHTDVAATVEIRTNNKKYRARVINPRGSPKNPLSDEFLDHKFMILASKVIDRGSLQPVIERVRRIESETNLGALIQLLRPS